MSATLDAARVAAHLGDAPVIDAPGRVFPVETRYLDKAQRQTISADAVRAVHRALDETDKSILVFLPGEAEIRRTEEALNSSGLPQEHRCPPALWRHELRRAGCRDQALATGRAQDRARHHHRRDQPHHRRHRCRHRHRLQACAALRPRFRHDGARNRPRVAGLRRPAPRPRGPPGPRHRLPPVARGRNPRAETP